MNKGTKRQAAGSMAHANHKSRFLMGWMLALVLVLTACGAGAGTNGGNESATTPTDTASNGASQTAGAFPVTISHMKGQYTLNEKPKKIAVLDVKFLDQLLAVGEQPAGSVIAEGNTTFPEYLGDKPGDVQVLGTRDKPNLEAIVALDPDLILMTDFQEKEYERVSKIAPTIVLDFYEDWRDTLATVAAITGKQAEAETVRKAYEDKIAGLKEKLSEKLGEETVALIRPRKEGIRVHGLEHRTGGILYEDLGLKMPALVQKIKDDTSVEISMEKVPEIGADHYFVLSDELFAAEAEALESSSVWKSLDAVKNNRAYDVNSTLWIAYYGPLAINIIVDQASEALLGSN
ncbi:iron(III) dicitrate ABC transporter permease [Paenibacillus polymyxa]|uniref:ABC transporter substrate-binding protein n=1 Tax=Paenibacillus polymyxa TaxID=1406 RepID=UPI00042F39C5|nr:iron-siderophore ABC transporter substrate-binding protein [Paenibacillus polymyxa]AHM67192.1 iron(III) dicitrate ABC transporter permease [Paenibacillus polymyxa SQR-21]AIY07988.1 iron(III) dicitrate ABC transporter permease [Paenibacillus polymyxa]